MMKFQHWAPKKIDNTPFYKMMFEFKVQKLEYECYEVTYHANPSKVTPKSKMDISYILN